MAKSKPIKNPSRQAKVATRPLWQREELYKYWIFLFAFLLFFNAIFNGYNLDDELVTINHRLSSKGISAIPEIFSSPYYQDASGYSYEYRPVVLASFAIEHEVFGDNAHVSHFFSIVLYALSCLLLYLVLLRLFRAYSPYISIAVTLLFIAHPAHTEVVCSIKNRDEILSLLFGLLSFYLALIAVQTSRRWILLMVPVSFMLALMSKITVVSFAVIIPIAIVFFTEADFIIVLLLTCLLLLPTFFLINFGLGQDKVMMVLGVVMAISFLYILINLKSLLDIYSSGLNNVFRKLFRQDSSAAIATDGPAYRFSDIFKGIVPDRSVLSLAAFFIPVFFAALYFLLLSEKHSFIAVLPILVLLALAWWGEKRLSWWANVMISFCLVLCSWYTIRSHLSQVYNMNHLLFILQVYFAYLIVFGRRDLFIPSLLSFLVLFFQDRQMFQDSFGIVTLLIMYLLANKYLRYLIAVAVVVSEGVRYYLYRQTENFTLPILNDLMIITIIGLIHFKNTIKNPSLVLTIIVIVISHSFLATRDEPVQIKDNLNTVIQATNKINPDVLPKHANRPLDFVEQCINLDSSRAERTGTSLEVMYHYLGKVLLPYPLSFYYGYRFIEPMKITDTIPLISLILHLVLLLAALVCIRNNKLVSFGLLTYLVSIVVFSNYFQPVPGMFADRFLLIPSIGWVIVAVAILQKVFKINKDAKWSAIPKPSGYVFFVLLFFYSCLTFARNFNWKDYLTLFEHDITYADDCAQAHNLLAIRLVKTSLAENVSPAEQTEWRTKAVSHFRKAIEIYPPFFNASYDLARTYSLLGNTDSAIYFFKKTLLIDSDFSDASVAIGQLLIEQNKLNESEPYFEALVRISPKNLDGYDKLSYVYFLEKDFRRSTGILRKAISEMPQNPQPYINLAKIYHNMKNNDSSAVLLQEALAVDPGNEEAKKYLHALGK